MWLPMLRLTWNDCWKMIPWPGHRLVESGCHSICNDCWLLAIWRSRYQQALQKDFRVKLCNAELRWETLQGNDKKSINDWSVAKVQNIRNKKSLVVQLGKNTTTGGYRGWQGHHSCDWIDSGWYLKSRLV